MDKVAETESSKIITPVYRMLIDIATGVDTCADRADKHDDGEDYVIIDTKMLSQYVTEGCLMTLTHHMLMMYNYRSRLVFCILFTVHTLLHIIT